MLVLTRKAEESVVIGDSIIVTVVQVEGAKVRLGIQAPAHVRILRRELRARAVYPEMRARPVLGRHNLHRYNN
jgi:carbon storage regulator CsrA